MKLENWFLVNHGKKTVIYGAVYGDKRGKFEDRREIKTSYVKKFYKQDDKILAETLNSTYELGKSDYQNVTFRQKDGQNEFEFVWKN